MDGKPFTKAERLHYGALFGEMKRRQAEVDEQGRKHRGATPPPEQAQAGDTSVPDAWNPASILPPQGTSVNIDSQAQCLTFKRFF